jgi:ribosomal protein S18 acetylase RimI-like enzyme
MIIEAWSGAPGPDLEMLAELLHACVHDGASVSFILPFSMDDARAFWTGKVARAIELGTRRVLMARDDNRRIMGTVQLDFATPPNQQHRAEVAKLLVRPEARRKGIAKALMAAIEDVARRNARTLITLDTRTGDNAERLYVTLGYVRAGVIPNYARGPHSPALEPTTIFYKELC